MKNMENIVKIWVKVNYRKKKEKLRKITMINENKKNR